MNNVLWTEISEGWCKVYMDDILIHADTLEQLRERTKRILDILRKEDLFLKPEKCDFETTEVEYLGFVVRPGVISMDPKKLAGIAN